MFAISDWYDSLGAYSFPTIFIRLTPAEREALLADQRASTAAAAVMQRLQEAIATLPKLPGFPYSAFVGADVCSPTDSALFQPGTSIASGTEAWELLATSAKVQAAFREGRTQRLTVRPFRRMDKTREFRMFFRDGKLLAMSQYCLERHFRRLEGRKTEIWERGLALATVMKPFIPATPFTADCYLKADGEMLLVDLNPWGPPTAPLLFLNWDRDWEKSGGLKLIPPPITMGGDVKVSF